jgi:hypothetical protein
MSALDISFLSMVGFGIISYITNRDFNRPHWQFVVAFLLLFLLASSAAFAATLVFDVKNNLFVFHIHTPIEYCVVSLLYVSSLENRKIKNVILISIPVFVVLCIFLSLFIQPVTDNNAAMIIVESMLTIIWSLLFIRETIMLQKQNTLLRFPMFWISVGLMFYFVGAQVFDGLLNYLMFESMELARRVYRLMYVFRFALMILLIVGAYCGILFKEKSWES